MCLSMDRLAAALLADKSLNITELVMSDIVPPRDPPGFTNDQRITKVTADVGDVKAVDQLFQGKQYTVVAAFHGLMWVRTSSSSASCGWRKSLIQEAFTLCLFQVWRIRGRL